MQLLPIYAYMYVYIYPVLYIENLDEYMHTCMHILVIVAYMYAYKDELSSMCHE